MRLQHGKSAVSAGTSVRPGLDPLGCAPSQGRYRAQPRTSTGTTRLLTSRRRSGAATSAYDPVLDESTRPPMIDEQTFLRKGTTAGYAERHPEDLFGAPPW